MGWARVVKSRRHASVPGCGVTAGLLDSHTPKEESAGRRVGGAFGRFFYPPAFSFLILNLTLLGQLTASGSGPSASRTHLNRLCHGDVSGEL